MNVLIVYAHPEPKSMNAAMVHAAVEALEAAGYQVRVSDLYAMQFNAVSDRSNFTSVHNSTYFKQQLEEMHATTVNGFAPDVAAEQEKVEWCDLMIWQFPLWWFTVPGILKGWVDRVFAMGRFYGKGYLYENGRFKGKKALLSFTTGGPQDDYLAGGQNGDLAGIVRPLHRGIFQFTGFTVLHPQVVYGPARLTEEQRTQELEQWKKRLQTIFEEAPLEVGHY